MFRDQSELPPGAPQTFQEYADLVVSTVERECGLKAGVIRGRGRSKGISMARHTACYLLAHLEYGGRFSKRYDEQKYNGLTLQKIGEAVGREHTTVRSSIETFNNLCVDRPNDHMRSTVERVRAKLSALGID